MTSLYIVVGFVGLFAFVIWLGLRAARKVGELENRTTASEKSTDIAKRAAAIDDDTRRADADRLRDELLDRKPK